MAFTGVTSGLASSRDDLPKLKLGAAVSRPSSVPMSSDGPNITNVIPEGYELPARRAARLDPMKALRYEIRLLGQVGSACGHTEPRTWESSAPCQRQFALGVPASAKAPAGPPQLAVHCWRAEAGGPQRQCKKVGR